MKKLIALLLAMIMVCGLATTAFAATTDDNGDFVDESTITISKTYTVTNDETSYPDETFEFNIVAAGVADGGVGSDSQSLPTVGDVTFETEDGTATKDVTIDLPTYTAVGIYTYTITEVVGDTAGVTYYADPITLVVTVIEQDGKVRVAAVHTEAEGEPNKSNAIENVYTAGSLSVGKTVTGIMGDLNKYFAITITLTGVEDEDYTGNVITVGETSYEQNPETVAVGTPATFYLKNGETIELGNIPYGVTYTVKEADYTGSDDNDGYDEPTFKMNDTDVAEADITKEEGFSIDGEIDTPADNVMITNNKGGDVDTGVALDSAPYIVMLVVAMVGMVALVAKKRYEV